MGLTIQLCFSVFHAVENTQLWLEKLGLFFQDWIQFLSEFLIICSCFPAQVVLCLLPGSLGWRRLCALLPRCVRRCSGTWGPVVPVDMYLSSPVLLLPQLGARAAGSGVGLRAWERCFDTRLWSSFRKCFMPPFFLRLVWTSDFCWIGIFLNCSKIVEFFLSFAIFFWFVFFSLLSAIHFSFANHFSAVPSHSSCTS